MERSYYVFVLVYGLVLGTCFVSSITTIMNADPWILLEAQQSSRGVVADTLQHFAELPA